MADLGALFRSVPPVTRTLLLALAAVTAPCLLGLASPATLALFWGPVARRFEIWRPFTSFFYGGSGFPLLYDFFLIYRNSSAMETLTYRSDTAEYAWLHIMLSVFIILFNIPIGLPFLFRPLLLAQTYVWCRVNPTVRVSIFGLFTLPTSLYPPALILLDLLTGGPAKALGGIVGLLAGHLWWFLFTYLPSHAPSHLRRANPLATPLFFKRQFPASQPMPQTVTGTGSGYTQATGYSTARSEASQAARHRWGGGQRLGGSAL